MGGGGIASESRIINGCTLVRAHSPQDTASNWLISHLTQAPLAASDQVLSQDRVRSLPPRHFVVVKQKSDET